MISNSLPSHGYTHGGKVSHLQVVDSDTRVLFGDYCSRRRRAEILLAIEKDVIGCVPGNAPDVRWSVLSSGTASIAGRELAVRRLVGRADNRSHWIPDVAIELTVVLPANVERRVPLMLTMRDWSPEEAVRSITRGDAATDRLRAFTDSMLEAGCGIAILNPESIQSVVDAPFTRGIIGMVANGRARKPHHWGALRAWIWGASRGIDYLERESAVDPERIGIDGGDRFGFAALLAMALDERFAVLISSLNGRGALRCSPFDGDRFCGDSVMALRHWMAANFWKCRVDAEGLVIAGAERVPFTLSMLVSLCAPRPIFVSSGIAVNPVDALFRERSHCTAGPSLVNDDRRSDAIRRRVTGETVWDAFSSWIAADRVDPRGSMS